jgi:hypothetical protein
MCGRVHPTASSDHPRLETEAMWTGCRAFRLSDVVSKRIEMESHSFQKDRLPAAIERLEY